MGLNLFSKNTASGAASGAAAGSSFGPWGTLAGGVIGGLSGAMGPSSVGGITGQGGELGEGARNYYDQAFPGTNAWERLGAGNPMGSMGAAETTAKAQKRNVDKQLATSAANVGAQTMTQRSTTDVTAKAHVKAAEIAGRASAAATAANYHPRDQANLMVAVTDGPGSPGYATPTSVSAHRDTAFSARQHGQAAIADSQTKRDVANFQRKESIARVGNMHGSIEEAAISGIKHRIHERSMYDPTETKAFAEKYINALQAVGWGTDAIKIVAKAFGLTFGMGRMAKGAKGIPKRTSVRPLGKKLKPPSGLGRIEPTGPAL